MSNKTLRVVYVLVTVLLSSLVSQALGAQHAPHVHERGKDFDEKAALAYSQDAIGRELGHYRLMDRQGNAFALEKLRGQPLLVSLIYTSCYHTCPALTHHLAQNVEIAREALGHDSFNIVTVGFDTPVDTPQRMRTFARERGIDDPRWHFLSTDPQTMERLVKDLGFIYFASPKGFDHLAQTTVVDADGVVYRQVYGADFPAPMLVEPLKELVFGRRAEASSLSGWINGVRLFCTIYDPSSGRYKFDYSLFIGIAIGLLCLGAVAVFLIRAWRQSNAAH